MAVRIPPSDSRRDGHVAAMMSYYMKVLDAVKSQKFGVMAAKAPSVVSVLADALAPHKKMGVMGL